MKNCFLAALVCLALYCSEINSKTVTVSLTVDSCANCGKMCAKFPGGVATCTRVMPTNPAESGQQVTVTTSGSAKCYSGGEGCTDGVSASSSTTGGSLSCTCEHDGGYTDV